MTYSVKEIFYTLQGEGGQQDNRDEDQQPAHSLLQGHLIAG